MIRRRALVLLALTVALSVGRPVRAATGDPDLAKQWGMGVVGAPAAWEAGAKGQDVVIAVVDTGIDLAHIEFRDRILPGRNYIDPSRPPQDDQGHGSHVAGIAAAGLNGAGVVGVAPLARILPVKVLNDQGATVGGSIDEGIRWAADHGAAVINLSLGDVGTQSFFGPSFDEAVRYAWSKGAIPVVAAGNDYVLSSGFSDQPALVVAATRRNDTAPDFSNGVGEAQWGLAAPGGGSTFDARSDDVWSTYWDGQTPNAYAYLAGTSMAAPHVSGAAAVLRALGATQQETVDILLTTAKDIGDKGRDSLYGAGRLSVSAAVAEFRRRHPGGPPPAGGDGSQTTQGGSRTGAASGSGNRQAATATTAGRPTSAGATGPASTVAGDESPDRGAAAAVGSAGPSGDDDGDDGASGPVGVLGGAAWLGSAGATAWWLRRARAAA